MIVCSFCKVISNGIEEFEKHLIGQHGLLDSPAKIDHYITYLEERIAALEDRRWLFTELSENTRHEYCTSCQFYQKCFQKDDQDKSAIEFGSKVGVLDHKIAFFKVNDHLHPTFVYQVIHHLIAKLDVDEKRKRSINIKQKWGKLGCN